MCSDHRKTDAKRNGLAQPCQNPCSLPAPSSSLCWAGNSEDQNHSGEARDVWADATRVKNKGSDLMKLHGFSPKVRSSVPLRTVLLLCCLLNLLPTGREPWSPVPACRGGSAAPLWSTSPCHRQCSLQRVLQMCCTKMTAKWFKNQRTEATTLSLAFSRLV